MPRPPNSSCGSNSSKDSSAYLGSSRVIWHTVGSGKTLPSFNPSTPLRKFDEALNQNPGAHFTPREVIRFMVDLVLMFDTDLALVA